MSLASGTRLGPYEVLSPLGAGGMGEVYRARDTRLGREVAVKVLPERLAATPHVRQRFEREAKTISQLSHPHICALYDVGRENETDYLVMELLTGQTLTQRLARGPLPLDQTLQYGIEMADALDKAHRQGIVHRDLKPANVMLTKSGVKLLDFGLAKAMAPAAPQSLTSLPTEPEALTQEGTILGTFQYMAPEQLEGREADARTDVFALGATLYEMATGTKAFAGTSQASLISAIMKSEPPAISSIQPLAPATLDRVVKTCLEKDPDERWQSAADIKRELKWIAEGSAAGVAAPAPVASRRRNRERLGWSAALLAGIAAAWLAGQRQRPADSSPAIRLSVPAPPQTTIGLGLALSSDGRSLAFVGTREGKQLLWLRLLGGVEARPLSGTDGAFNPFWSPDARFIGFFADNKLKTIEVASGSVRTLCSLQTIEPLSGGTWSPSGFILFGPDSHSPLFRVSAGGGVPAPATELDRSRKESAHIWPEFLPDGRHFLYWSLAGEEQGVAVAEVGSRAKKLLIPGAPKAVYAPPGFVLFSRGGTLYSQPFDATHLQLSGEPIPTAEGVDYDFSAARDGIVAYRAGAIDVRQFRWFDRAGKELAKVGRPGDYLDPTLSPDGTRLAVGIGEWTPVGDIWLLDVARGSFSRLTSHPFDDITPVWSPDGKQIAFASNRNGAFDLFRKDVGGAGNEELLLHSNVDKFPMDWSRDGRSLVFITIDPKTRADMWILPMTGERKPSLFLQTEYNESNAALSPDGHWIAYNSDESGMPEVYVRPFPSGADRWQVSTQGGVQPAWRADGRELYYASPDTKIMAVEIKPASGFAAGLPVALFQAPIRAEGITESHTAFAASPDGQRFLVNTINEDAARVPITVVVHWASELKP